MCPAILNGTEWHVVGTTLKHVRDIARSIGNIPREQLIKAQIARRIDGPDRLAHHAAGASTRVAWAASAAMRRA